MTQTDLDAGITEELVDILNLMFTSGMLSCHKRIWLDRDQDDIYVELLILTSISMKSE